MRFFPARRMPKLYINLDRRADRRARMEASRRAHPVLANLERIPGCDGRDIEDFARLPGGVCISRRQQRHIAANGPSRGGMHTPGSVGLGISYKAALDRIIAEAWDHTLVLEDDAAFVDDFGPRLEGLPIPDGYDAICLGYTSAPRAEAIDPWYMRAHRVYGTFAIIWSLAGARKVVDELKLFDPFKYALDTRFYFGLDRDALAKYCVIDRMVRHPPQHTTDDPSDILIRSDPG